MRRLCFSSHRMCAATMAATMAATVAAPTDDYVLFEYFSIVWIRLVFFSYTLFLTNLFLFCYSTNACDECEDPLLFLLNIIWHMRAAHSHQYANKQKRTHSFISKLNTYTHTQNKHLLRFYASWNWLLEQKLIISFSSMWNVEIRVGLLLIADIIRFVASFFFFTVLPRKIAA